MPHRTKFRKPTWPRPIMHQIDRISPTRRPRGPATGYHTWSDLLFIHWRVPAEILQPLIPPELTIDTCDGSAWVGLVPFRMSNVRPRWAPAVWGLSDFPETNVRTYVHFRGADPGVWFFSLDAANLIAVKLARIGWGLNYHWAQMRVRKEASQIEYSSRRRSCGSLCNVTAALSGHTTHQGETTAARQAEPGTLEHFLVERYLLYAQRHDVLYRGQVHHKPYPLHDATLQKLDESLLRVNHIPVSETPCHVVYSPGVNVEVFRLQAVQTNPTCKSPNTEAGNI